MRRTAIKAEVRVPEDALLQHLDAWHGSDTVPNVRAFNKCYVQRPSPELLRQVGTAEGKLNAAHSGFTLDM